jgi:hypothetical protein
VTRADEGKTVVINDKGMCNQKIEPFLQENQFFKINKYPTNQNTQRKRTSQTICY